MKKLIGILLVLFILVLANLLISPNKSFSDQLDDITKQINDLNTALNMSINATRPLESQLQSMQTQITNIKTQVVFIENDIAEKKKNIDQGYRDIEQKTVILNEKIRDYYIKSSLDSPLLTFLSATNAEDMTNMLAYQKAAEDQDKMIITNVVLSIVDLERKKKNLESEEIRLKSFKASLDDQSAKLDKIVQGAKAYQSSLSNQIAQLSAQQQQLLAQKYASLGIPQTAYAGMGGGCSSDLTNGKDPGFSPKFGFFTYGVPNRIGMNQYGAKGRAEAGQKYQDILHAYYNADISSGYSTSATIHVTGTNDYGQSFDTSWNIEEYVKHIYEIPTNWSVEALKAQAIAARSYALATTNNGSSSICSDQHCQEVKQELNSDAWIQAVNATAGQVLTSGGQPIKAWFSSTHGGYVYKSSDIGWSDTSYTKNAVDASGTIGSFSDLQNNAYDKSSPWFYCDWGNRSQYGGTAWLKPSEVADIVNVILLAKNDSGTTKHLTQADKANPDGTDTWDANKVKQELQNRNVSSYSSISNISVDWDKGSGRVTTVTVNGDGGSQSFAGDFFKQFFNLRAPANIQIVGPLYNIEQR